ncbi:hypothetical protein GQ53DRAFT_808792 [Thozetella sp. PMI_491]|nr:hypothetical protein GQ53DRAFT_808792 [Thozetella sp. PMI_491]
MACVWPPGTSELQLPGRTRTGRTEHRQRGRGQAQRRENGDGGRGLAHYPSEAIAEVSIASRREPWGCPLRVSLGPWIQARSNGLSEETGRGGSGPWEAHLPKSSKSFFFFFFFFNRQQLRQPSSSSDFFTDNDPGWFCVAAKGLMSPPARTWAESPLNDVQMAGKGRLATRDARYL